MMESMNSNYYSNPPSSSTSSQQPQPQSHYPEFNPASLRNASPMVNSAVYSQQIQSQHQQQQQQQQYSGYVQPSALDSPPLQGNFQPHPPSNLSLSSSGIQQQQQQPQTSLLLSPPLTSSTLSKPLLQSPTLNFSSLYSTRARFNASKGFDIEDDLEFCPITQAQRAEARLEAQSQSQTSPTSTTSGHVNPYANYFTSTGGHHKFNPYSTSFSPSSPSLGNANLAGNGNYVTSPNATATNSGGAIDSSPRVLTPRGKRFNEGNVVNRVASPRLHR